MLKRSPAFTHLATAKIAVFPCDSPLPTTPRAHCAELTDATLLRGQHPAISLPELEANWKSWLYDCQYRLHSPRTIEFRQDVLGKLLWFCRLRGFQGCGPVELRQFLIYVENGHKEPEGRWGNPKMVKPVRPRTVHRYYRELKTFFSWMVAEELLADSPMRRIRPPALDNDQVQPFTDAQIKALLQAAQQTSQPKRDTAILFLLFDTGLRASELCGMRWKDVNLRECCCQVQGKGNKKRMVYFGRKTMRALSLYRQVQPFDSDDEPLFISERSIDAGEPLTRDGLRFLMRRLGDAAGIQRSRCSPHTCRHTFAINFLRQGGNLFSLKEMLGHTSLRMTNNYVALTQADLAEQQRQFSPMDNLKKRLR